MQRSTHLVAAKTSLVCKFPHVLLGPVECGDPPNAPAPNPGEGPVACREGSGGNSR